MTDVPPNLPSLVDIVADLATRLKLAGPVLLGEKYLVGQESPRRWVVVPGPIATTNLGRLIKTNPRSFCTEEYSLFVHCWGNDEVDAMRMRFAFTTALRQSIGANFGIGGATPLPRESSWTQRGYVIVGTYTTFLPHPETNLDALLGDAVKQTVQITSVGLDDTQGTPGDGELDTGES